MHPNRAFRTVSRDENLGFARARGFGVLTVNGADGPLAAHVPFLLDAEGATLEAHLLRVNPVWAALEAPAPARMIVSGPDGYVSPDWYGLDDQVPTWNYVAVHLTGTLRRGDPAETLDHAARLSARFEAALAPKRAWTMAKMTPGRAEAMARAIVPVRLEIAGVEGTWKLNQNKPAAAREAAAAAMAGGTGQELSALAALMRAPPGS